MTQLKCMEIFRLIPPFKLNDPNLFHFYNLTGSLIKNFRSIFELDKTLLPGLEEKLGFCLKLKESKIEHQGR